jgi:hypothetical protein
VEPGKHRARPFPGGVTAAGPEYPGLFPESGMASGIQTLIERGRMKTRRNIDAETLDKRFKTATIKASQVGKTFPTGGEWTKSISYNPDKGEVTVTFKDGFVAVYDNITLEEYQDMFRGSVTKGKPRRGGSIGAWLHKHPNVMYNYREATK